MSDNAGVQGAPNPPGVRTDGQNLEAPAPAPTPTPAGDAGPGSPVSANALARFEFEKDKANEGTKILMVEWNASPSDELSPSPSPQHQSGWEVDFEGKAASFPLSEEDSNGTRRVYFLIAPQVTIPPEVTISQPGTGYKTTAKSMPAIFAPGLGVDSKDAGKRGVLHTIWANKRLSQLQEEIQRELQDNSEGVGLEMALQERQWIVDHFGLEPLESNSGSQAATTLSPIAPPSPTPQTPRTPVGGRLGERLKGLRLATSPTDLANKPGKLSTGAHIHLIQTLTFGLFLGTNANNPHLHPVLPDSSRNGAATGVGSGPAVASLDAVIGGQKPAGGDVAPGSRDTEDELFALPMSPRSPEMTTSPFSLLK